MRISTKCCIFATIFRTNEKAVISLSGAGADDDPKPTEIEVPKATQQSIVVEIYDLSGRCISQLQRGLNIVKMSDGTTKKIIVK